MTTFWSFIIWACLIGTPVFYVRLRMAATALGRAKAARVDGNEGEAQRQLARGAAAGSAVHRDREDAMSERSFNCTDCGWLQVGGNADYALTHAAISGHHVHELPCQCVLVTTKTPATPGKG